MRNDPAARTLADRLRAEGREALALDADALQSRAEEAEAKVADLETRLAVWEDWVRPDTDTDTDDGTEAEAPAKVQAPSLHDYDVRHALGEV